MIATMACAGSATAQGFVWNAPLFDHAPAVIGVHRTATASDGDTAVILNLGPNLKLPKVGLFDTALGSMAWEVELPATCLAKAYEGYAIGQAIAFAPDGDVVVLSTTVATGVVCVVRYARTDGHIVWQHVEHPASGTDELMDATQLAFDPNGDAIIGGARRVGPAMGSAPESWLTRATKLDRHTGNALWTFESPPHADRRYSRTARLGVSSDGSSHLLGFFGGSSPAIQSGYTLTRLDNNGLALWEQGDTTSATGSIEPSEGTLGVPGDGSAFVSAWMPDRAGYALRRYDAASGNVVWTRERPADSGGDLVMGPDGEVLVEGPGLIRLNVANGQPAWQLAPPASKAWLSAVMVGNSKAVVLETTTAFPRQYWIRSVALDAGTVGTAVPVDLARPGGAATNFVFVHSLAADAASGRASLVAFVRIDNGHNEPSNVFATSIEGRSATFGSTIDATPTLRINPGTWTDATKTIVTGDQDVVGSVYSSGRQLFVKHAGRDGTLRWQVAAGGEAVLTSGLAAIGNDGDFVYTASGLTRRSGVDGHILWSVPSPASTIVKPLVDAAGNILALVEVGSIPDPRPFPLPNSGLGLYAVAKFSGANGALQWMRQVGASDRRATGIRIASNGNDKLIVAADGDLVVAGLDQYWDANAQPASDGFVARLDPSNGTLRWRQEFPMDGYAAAVAFSNADVGFVSATQIARVSGQTGQVLWRQPNVSGVFPSYALADATGNIVFGSAEQSLDEPGGWRVAGADGNTGALRWSMPAIAGTPRTGILHLVQAADGTILAAGRCNKTICIGGFDPDTGNQRYRLVHEYPDTTVQTHQTLKLMVDALGRVYAALTAPGAAYAAGEPAGVTAALARLSLPTDDELFADGFD